MLGVFFQGQAQQRSDMADVRAELRSGFAEVRGRNPKRLRAGRMPALRRWTLDSRRWMTRFVQVDQRFAQVNGRLDGISRDLGTLRERVARIEGHLTLPADTSPHANATP